MSREKVRIWIRGFPLGESNHALYHFIILTFYHFIVICIPVSVELLCGRCFLGCEALSSVRFETGSKISRIDQFAFSDCSSLSSICLPDGHENALHELWNASDTDVPDPAVDALDTDVPDLVGDPFGSHISGDVGPGGFGWLEDDFPDFEGEDWVFLRVLEEE
jgi:hypothetical protein